MAYAHGEYYALGEKIGKFGFSAAKNQEAKQYAERSKRKLSLRKSARASVKPKAPQAKSGAKSHPVPNKTHNSKRSVKNEKSGKR